MITINGCNNTCYRYLEDGEVRRNSWQASLPKKSVYFVGTMLFFLFSYRCFCQAAESVDATRLALRYVSRGHVTIAIVGVGAVGATVAYALMLQNMSAEIILVDMNEKRCHGESLDLSDAIPFSYTARVRQGSFRDAAQADIIVITAGARRQPGQSRLDLVKTNQHIVTTIIQNMQPINQHAVMIVVSNPVDLMTSVAQQVSNLPRAQVFGSGTLLDSQRLGGLIAQKLGVSEQSVHAYIIGEHGDSQCVAWSCASIAGIPISQFEGMTPAMLVELARSARDKGQEIIACKDATFYGIGACVSHICESIIYNQKRVIPVSCYQESSGVCLSMPAIVGERGIEQILALPLNTVEEAQLSLSAEMIKSMLEQIL